MNSITFLRSLLGDAPFRGIQIGLRNKAHSKLFFGSKSYHLKRCELKLENLASEKIAKISIRMKHNRVEAIAL